MIWTPGRIGVVGHYGIYFGAPNGIPLVIHNSKVEGKVVIETLGVFSEGKRIHIERRAMPGRGQNVIQAALAYWGKKYDLLQFNCEHFVSIAHEGSPKSPQLGTAVGFGIIASLLGLAWHAESRPTYDTRVGRYRDKRGRFVAR